jgi:hypothetical protein
MDSRDILTRVVCTCIIGILCLTAFTLIPSRVKACFALGVDCEDASMGTYDGGAVDVEYHKIFPSERRVVAGTEHSYLIYASYSPGCGIEYSARFTVIQPSSGFISLKFPNGDNANGVGMGWHDSGICMVNLTVTAGSVTVRLQADDTYACNEHNTVDVITSTVVSTYPDIDLKVTSPKRSEYYMCGSVRAINWTAIGGKGALNINLEYSTKGGSVWVPIANGLANTGTYSWTIPTVPLSYNCYIRATASDTDSPPLNRNITSAKFYIKPTGLVPPMVTLLMPNGGQWWKPDWNVTLKWEAVGGKGTLKVKLEFSTEGNTGPWQKIGWNLYNTGTFPWHVPNNLSDACYIRVTVNDASSPPQTANDTNGIPFRITYDNVPEAQSPFLMSMLGGAFLLICTIALVRRMGGKHHKL